MAKDNGDIHPITLEANASGVPCPRLIGKGDSGDDVWAMQDALQHWSIQNRPKGEKGTRRYAPTGTARFPTINQVKHFQDLHSIPQTGVTGPRTWNLMVPFMSGRAVDKAHAAYKKYHPDTTRDKIVRAALDGYANRTHIHYVQVRPMAWHHTHPRSAENLFAEDCSSFSTWCYWVAGAPDPNGMNFDGYGNTSSQRAHGKSVFKPRPGDLVHYSNPDHVAIYIGDSRVISNGHYPMGNYPAGYRQVYQYRDYLGD